jgi:hypothetical protein
MKIQHFLIVALVSMSSFSEYAKGSETVISSVPFTITTSGTYILSGDLTYAGSNSAITVKASNVVIDLKGFTLFGSGPETNSIGIAALDTEDFAIRNGEINGFGTGLSLGGELNVARNLTVTQCKTGMGINLNPGGFGFCEIRDCFIDGTGEGTGVSLSSTRNLVQHCQILDYRVGADSVAGGNIFIANSIFDCKTGLRMQTSDKYQGNVTNGCTTPFSGGTAVGDENN